LLIISRKANELLQLNIVVNWIEELRRRVPIGK